MEPQPVKTYLAWDPGQTTGWALFDLAGKPLMIGEVQYGTELWDLINEILPVEFYVVENYRVRPEEEMRKSGYRYTKKWDEAIAARAIGFIQAGATCHSIPVYFQEPNIKPIAAQTFGLPNNRSDKMNAVLHGLHYARRNLGLMPPVTDSSKPKPVKTEKTEPTVVPISGYGDLRKALRKRK